MPTTPQSDILDPIPGAPVAGTNAVQTLTIGGTPTGGTFRLRKDGVPTLPITWSATNATLLANLQARLDAAYGTNALVATAGTLAAGIGTILLTAGGRLAMQPLSTLTVAENALIGTAPTVAVATTTPGVAATHRDARPGALVRSENGNVYRNSSTIANAPTWVTI